MVHWLTQLLGGLGPLLVFGLIFLECMGLPFPGETVLLTAAAFAATGRLSIAWVFIAAALGGFVGGATGYALGRGATGAWLHRRGHGAPEARGAAGHILAGLGRARTFFQGHGGKSVLLGRFVAIVRSFVFIVAGGAGMRLVPFLLWDAAGAILWSGVYAFLGYEFGQNLPRLEHVVGAAGLAIAGALGLVAALALVIRWTWVNQDRIWLATSSSWDAHVRPRLTRFADAHPRLWRFAADRLSPAGYLGLHLTIGIFVSLLALWLFGGVLEDVIAGDPLIQFDKLVAETLHTRATPLGIHFFLAVSLLGSVGFWTLLGGAVLVLLLLRRQRLLALGWVAAIGGGGILDLGLKLIVHRARPSFSNPFTFAPGWSFPSGHSMGAVIGYGVLAYFLLLALERRGRGLRVLVVTTTCVVVGLIGLSRLYLGVHYFSDVVGGFAAGVVWLSACVTGMEVARRRRSWKQLEEDGPNR